MVKYERPNYEYTDLLEDIMIVSVQEDEDRLSATIKIEDLMTPSNKEI